MDWETDGFDPWAWDAAQEECEPADFVHRLDECPFDQTKGG